MIIIVIIIFNNISYAKIQYIVFLLTSYELKLQTYVFVVIIITFNIILKFTYVRDLFSTILPAISLLIVFSKFDIIRDNYP